MNLQKILGVIAQVRKIFMHESSAMNRPSMLEPFYAKLGKKNLAKEDEFFSDT